jgi:hypothetical protein
VKTPPPLILWQYFFRLRFSIRGVQSGGFQLRPMADACAHLQTICKLQAITNKRRMRPNN